MGFAWGRSVKVAYPLEKSCGFFGRERKTRVGFLSSWSSSSRLGSRSDLAWNEMGDFGRPHFLVHRQEGLLLCARVCTGTAREGGNVSKTITSSRSCSELSPGMQQTYQCGFPTRVGLIKLVGWMALRLTRRPGEIRSRLSLVYRVYGY